MQNKGNDVDGETICKTILCSIRDFDAKCKMIDKSVMRCGVASMGNNIYKCFDRMVDLVNEKITYHNIRAIIYKAINDMKHKEVLVMAYIMGYSRSEITAKLGINERAYFRRLKKQVDTLYSIILNDYSEVELFQIIKSYSWLRMRYAKLLELKGKNGSSGVKIWK